MTVPLVRPYGPVRAPDTESQPRIKAPDRRFEQKLTRADAQLRSPSVRAPDRRQVVDAASRPSRERAGGVDRDDVARREAPEPRSTRGPEVNEGDRLDTERASDGGDEPEATPEQTVGEPQDPAEGDVAAGEGPDLGGAVFVAALTTTPAGAEVAPQPALGQVADARPVTGDSGSGVPQQNGQAGAILLPAGGTDVGHEQLPDQASVGSRGFSSHMPQGQSAAVPFSLTSAPSAGQDAATPAPAPPPPAALSVEDQANVARVARGIAGAVIQNGGVVTLRLQPPEMGMVRIELQISAGTIRAAFVAEQESARALLHGHIDQLRHALQGHGLNVDRLNVQTMQSNDSTTDTEQQAGDSPADGRSRGAFDDSGRRAEGPEGADPEPDGQAAFQQTLNAVA